MAKWKPKDHLAEVKKLASLGLTEAQIATKLNVHPDVFRWHRNDCKELERAMQEGLNTTIESAEGLLQLIRQQDFKAIKFWLEKRGGWGDDISTSTVSKPSFNNFNLKPTPMPEKEEDVAD